MACREMECGKIVTMHLRWLHRVVIYHVARASVVVVVSLALR